MTRILHTSDWHLGACLEGLSRDEEHGLFLAWLSTALEQQRIDVLIIAGDIFDQAQPSAEAQRSYYRFLHRVAGKSVRKVVVVGGNHDSASRLDAPHELLSALDVHVVGGLQADRATWDRCLCPIRDERGQVQCVVVAVPFVHEFRLGVRTALCDESEIRASFTEAFGALYRELADRAVAIADGAPILATGHLPAEGSDRKDAPADVHMVGAIGGLSASIFDPRFCYVALGHIHRSFRVQGSRAWYSGTPVALGLRETDRPRRVLVFEAGATLEEQVPQALEVPQFRPILEVAGAVAEVEDALRTLTWDTPLAPFVYPKLEVEHFAAGLEARIVKAAEANPRAGLRLLQPKQVVRGGQGQDENAPAPVRLQELSPEEVFLRLCEARKEPVDEALMQAFRSLLSAGVEGREGAP